MIKLLQIVAKLPKSAFFNSFGIVSKCMEFSVHAVKEEGHFVFILRTFDDKVKFVLNFRLTKWALSPRAFQYRFLMSSLFDHEGVAR